MEGEGHQADPQRDGEENAQNHGENHVRSGAEDFQPHGERENDDERNEKA